MCKKVRCALLCCFLSYNVNTRGVSALENETVCKFLPMNKDYYSLHIINFVLETNKQIFSDLHIESLYKIHLVTNGIGALHTKEKTYELTPGSLFFTFPGFPYAIESLTDDFNYMYISFLGTRGNLSMEYLEINTNNFLFSGFEDLKDFWKTCITTTDDVLNFKSESALLYAFSLLGEKFPKSKNFSKKYVTAVLIKKYIDDNYTNPEITLEAISNEINYNKKYISTAFKKDMGLSIIEYLQKVRIQHACSMMKQGCKNVTEISFQSGFSSPQYFATVFRKNMHLSPKEYMKAFINR